MSDPAMPTRPGIYIEKDASWETTGWTSVPNAAIRDKTLPWDCKGALAWIASHQVRTYKVTAEDLAAAGPRGRNHAYEMVRTLEQHGWLTRRSYFNPETGRTDIHLWTLHTTAVPPEERTYRPSRAKPRAPHPGLKESTPDRAGTDPAAEENPRSERIPERAGTESIPGRSVTDRSITDRAGALYKEEKTSREDQEELPTSPAAPPREDVEQLCARLKERMIENGCKPPTITKGWRDAARLLLDKDGRDLGKALNLIDWATRDEFWMANVQSMGKFRQQYDTLRLRAVQEYRRKTSTAPRSQTAMARETTAAAVARVKARLEADERSDRPALEVVR